MRKLYLTLLVATMISMVAGELVDVAQYVQNPDSAGFADTAGFAQTVPWDTLGNYTCITDTLLTIVTIGFAGDTAVSFKMPGDSITFNNADTVHHYAIMIVDSSGVDSAWIYDDGAALNIASENPVNIGTGLFVDDSLVIDDQSLTADAAGLLAAYLADVDSITWAAAGSLRIEWKFGLPDTTGDWR